MKECVVLPWRPRAPHDMSFSGVHGRSTTSSIRRLKISAGKSRRSCNPCRKSLEAAACRRYVSERARRALARVRLPPAGRVAAIKRLLRLAQRGRSGRDRVVRARFPSARELASSAVMTEGNSAQSQAGGYDQPHRRSGSLWGTYYAPSRRPSSSLNGISHLSALAQGIESAAEYFARSFGHVKPVTVSIPTASKMRVAVLGLLRPGSTSVMGQQGCL